jgi:hypothetical protein
MGGATVREYPTGIGHRRQAVGSAMRIAQDTIIDRTRPRAEIHELGALAEWYVARRYGQERQVKAEGPYDCDLASGAGAHLDVKHTAHDNGKLIRYRDPHKAEHWCLAYVLVVGARPEAFRVAGWAWGWALRKSWDETLPTPAWALPQSALRPHLDPLMAATFGWAPVRPWDDEP